MGANAHKLKLNGICAPRVLDDGTHNMRLSKIIKSNCLAVEILNGTHNRHIQFNLDTLNLTNAPNTVSPITAANFSPH